MSLTDGDVALLARQAVDLLDPDVDLQIEPDRYNDPYRLARASWTVWPLLDARRSFGIHLAAGMTHAAALAQLIDGLSDGVAESQRFWARVFPTCGEHPHAASAVVGGDVVAIRCPETGEERTRVVPAVP